MPNSAKFSLSSNSCFCRTAKLVPAMLAVVTLIAFAPSSRAQEDHQAQSHSKGLVALPKSKPFGLNPGDVIDVQVFDTPELSAKYQLNQEGAIRLPGTGSLVIGGLTTTEAAALLEKQLKEWKVMDEAQVSVFLDKAAPVEVSVSGEVNHPGNYTLSGLPTLESALSAAGGVTQLEGATITITHRDQPHPDTIRVDATNPAGNDPFIALRPWDIISVSQAGRIYVVGDVGRPGQYYLNNGRSLRALEALAIAEGLKDYAAPDKATIIHSTPNGVTSTRINLTRVQKNLDPDLVLEPDDVLVVPHSGMKQFAAVMLPGLTSTAVNAVAIALATR